MTAPDIHTALLTDRCVLEITGTEQIVFLQGLITQDVTTLKVGSLRYGALLTPQGKLLVDFFVLGGRDSILLDCPKSAAASLQQKLMLYKLRADVTISDVSDSYSIFAQWGNTTPAIGLPDPRAKALGHRLYFDHAPTAPTPSAPACTAPLAHYQAHLIHEGVAQFGSDMTAQTSYPMDMNLDALNGIDFLKGCFVGQEVTSRMKRKGAVRKRLYCVEFAHTAPPPGTVIKTAGTQGVRVGTLTSCMGSAGLALVRTDKIANYSSFITAADEKRLTLYPPSYLEVP